MRRQVLFKRPTCQNPAWSGQNPFSVAERFDPEVERERYCSPLKSLSGDLLADDQRIDYYLDEQQMAIFRVQLLVFYFPRQAFLCSRDDLIL